MRKAIITFLIISFGFGSLHSQQVIEERNSEIAVLNGIKTRTQIDDSFMGSKVMSENLKTSFVKYNKEGKVIEQIAYKAKDTLSMERYKYNEEGYRTQYTKHKGGAMVIAYKKISKYNNDGNLTLETGFDGVDNFKNVYAYYPDGKLSEIKYFRNNMLDEKREFKHTGNIADINVYNATGSLTSRLKLKYNSTDNLVEESVIGIDGKEIEKKIYSYDDKNRITDEVKYRKAKFYYKTLYTYNKKGLLSEILEESPNVKKFVKKKFSYDENGNLIEMQWRRNEDEEFSSKKYEYNSKNICTGEKTFYPSTSFKILSKYSYEFY